MRALQIGTKIWGSSWWKKWRREGFFQTRGIMTCYYADGKKSSRETNTTPNWPKRQQNKRDGKSPGAIFLSRQADMGSSGSQ